ncbi:MAG: class I SAM-dependent methyltransferase [Oscillospiraceae bacterium]|jgi:SAM-dependent methyltransferase|nr:class I SAM-dependent methyltransferase [Oscillospiraceae bacterium]
MKDNAFGGGYGAFAAVYDDLTRDVDYPALAEYYDGLIADFGAKKGAGGGILLDLACGTGTLSLLMAKRGWDVIGADASPEMLGAAAGKPSKGVAYVCQDMTELDLYGTVDAAICALDGLNHLPDEAALFKSLSRVSLFMNAGGVFVFDVNTVYKHEKILGDHVFIKRSGGVYCVWSNHYENDGVVDITLDIFRERRDGAYTKSVEEIREKAYPLDAVRAVSEEAGFNVRACLDFMTRGEGGEDSEKAVFVLTKP